MMSETTETIMDAAERMIRAAGYSGFSFREIAAEVGIKSASVHYHFPTKEALAAAVARRYTDRFTRAVDEERATGRDAVAAWRQVFRRSLAEDGRMCLCGVLGAAARDLPDDVAFEARRFFQVGLERLTASGMSRESALRVLATLEGAMLMSSALGDVASFDDATLELA
jgi:TetR/AcrR family transcriptional repressor of nem operon